MSEITNPGNASSEPTWTILTTDVKLKKVEDLKEVYFKNNKTGVVHNMYDYMMQQMGISAAQQLHKQDQKRQKKVKERKAEGA